MLHIKQRQFFVCLPKSYNLTVNKLTKQLVVHIMMCSFHTMELCRMKAE